MKSLIESCNNMNSFDDYIEEGKIWDKIKGWFKNFFEPDSDKEFDRYSSEHDFNDGQNLVKYKEYIKDHFNIDKLDFIKVDPNSIKSIIIPNGKEPNEEMNIGFWKFKKYLKDSNTKKYKFFAFTYTNDQIKDVPALISCKGDKNDGLGNALEILNLQILSEYSEVLKVSDVIKYFLKEDISKSYDVIKFYKTNEPELFNKLINDCEFESKEINGKKYCKYVIK